MSLLEVALTDSKIHRNGQYRAVKSTKILENMSRKEALQLQSAKGPTIGCPARGFNGTTIGRPAFKNQNSFRALCPLAGGCGRRRRAGRRTWGPSARDKVSGTTGWEEDAGPAVADPLTMAAGGDRGPLCKGNLLKTKTTHFCAGKYHGKFLFLPLLRPLTFIFSQYFYGLP